MAAAKKKSKPKGRRRVWVKSHCRKRPVAAWRKEMAKSKEMPF